MVCVILSVLEALVDFGDKLLGIERLGNVVVAPQREAVQAVSFFGAVGKEEYHDVAVGGADDAGQLKPVDARHVDVQQYEVGFHLAVHRQPCRAVGRVVHLIALRLDETAQQH